MERKLIRRRAIPTPPYVREEIFEVEEPLFPDPEEYPGPTEADIKNLLLTLPTMFPPIPPVITTPSGTITPMLTQEIKNKEYKNYIIDLSTARTIPAPLGIRDLGVVADTMSVIKAEASFDYRINKPTNDPTPAEKGFVEDQFEIEEVYITNAAAAGKQAIIRVNWNPRMIRPKQAG